MMTDKQTKAVDEDRVISTMQKQFRGGEHRLAGQRASELIYAGGKQNAKLSDKIIEAIPGIERYISAPDAPIMHVSDQGGDPLSNQPENRDGGAGASNVSSDQAIAEQNAIDKKLEKGRQQRVKKDVDQKTGGEDATKLNPDGSTQEDADKK